MKFGKKTVVLEGSRGDIIICRNEHGIPVIRANCHNDLALGLGYMHARDRQLQVLLTRILVQGRAAECLAGEPALIEVDRYMRRMNFLPDAESEIAKMEPGLREMSQSYVDGFNRYLEQKGAVMEFKLLKYTPEPLQIKDVLVIAKIMGFIGLGDAQGGMEKLIVQMIQHGIEERKLRELFPFLTDKIDYDLMKKVTLVNAMAPESLKWLQRVPKFIASNNWVVSGKRTRSGKPILCNDPHLEVNRIPSVWYEVVMELPHDTIIGASLPGAPGILIGRTNKLSFGATFAFMDMIDFFVEQCKNGKYRRGNKWVPFRVREERINVKNGEPVIERVYENDLGVLEGDPTVEGHYLVMRWAAARDCGAGDSNYMNVIRSASVKEAMGYYRKLESGSWNMIMADSDGNIGYQMTGRLFNRPAGVSGLVPLPAWDAANHGSGFVKSEEFPSRYNPPEGYIVTANNNLNSWGRCRAINLPMAPYRADRITQMLKQENGIGVDHMKAMHFDLHSLQAERFMEALKPLVPDTVNGRILKGWNCAYDESSLGAMLFESVYRELLLGVFGDHGMGREVMEHLLTETSIFNDYYGNFDDILVKRYSPWFNNRERDDIYRAALERGLDVKAVPYGKTRKLTISHLLFGGKLPRLFGFDRGPISLPGGRATIPQGQIFRSAGRTTTFSPSYRIISDMSTESAHTNLAGGPSDRRFSRWYFSDFRNWLEGRYKTLP
jgi:penicillin amidase